MTGPTLDWIDWLPIGIRRGAADWEALWCRFGRETALREPFFMDSVATAMRSPFNQAFGRRTPLSALVEWQARSPGLPPTAFVFHISRCGSTLLAQMLARLDSHVVLSEPPPLDALLRMHYTDPDAAAHQAGWITALLSAYGQRRRGSERALIVKLDAWSLFELPLLQRCFPATPCLFLYREPSEVVASHLRAPGRHIVPRLIGPTPLAVDDNESGVPTRPAHIARITGRLLEAGLRACREAGAIPVNYGELPHAMAGRLAQRLALRTDDFATVFDAARWDAKRPQQHFAATPAGTGTDPELRDAVARWATPAYAALEAFRHLAGDV